MTPRSLRCPRTAAAAALVCVAQLSGCGSQSPQDDTAAVQAAVDRGGTVVFEARTYLLTRTIVIRHSDTSIQGAGPATLFEFRPGTNRVHCQNDRVFTTSCAVNDTAPRHIVAPIAIGDTAFTTDADASDLQAGDWLIVSDIDSVIGDVVNIDWVQVSALKGQTVEVTQPFRTAFQTVRSLDPGRSGLGFQRVSPLVQNVELRDFTVAVDDAGPARSVAGISIFGALNASVDHVIVDDPHAQPLYCYLAKGVSITNSEAHGGNVLSEFASSVDLTIQHNHFASSSAGFGLDLGAAYFDVSDNAVDQSENVGTYLLYGVHDGQFSNNRVGYVRSAADAAGLLAWCDQNVVISNNYLDGGDGTRSIGMSVRGCAGEIPIPAVNIQLIGNSFGPGWTFDYEPGTVPVR